MPSVEPPSVLYAHYGFRSGPRRFGTRPFNFMLVHNLTATNLHMIKTILLLMVACLLVSAESVNPDVIKVIGDYRLEVRYLHKGTRSEGMEGRLYFKNEEVVGEEGQTIKVEDITIKYYGKKREFMWSTSGWNLYPAIKHSWIKE